MGFLVRSVGYEFPANIYSPQIGVPRGPSFLNTCLYGEKISATPDDYVFELDAD